MTVKQPWSDYRQHANEHCLEFLARLEAASAQNDTPWSPEVLKTTFWQGLAREAVVKRALGYLLVASSSAEALAKAYLVHLDTDFVHDKVVARKDNRVAVTTTDAADESSFSSCRFSFMPPLITVEELPLMPGHRIEWQSDGRLHVYDLFNEVDLPQPLSHRSDHESQHESAMIHMYHASTNMEEVD